MQFRGLLFSIVCDGMLTENISEGKIRKDKKNSKVSSFDKEHLLYYSQSTHFWSKNY